MSTRARSTVSAQTLVTGYSSNYLNCRVGERHQWRLYRIAKSGSSKIWRFYCPSCKTDKKQPVDRFGRIIKGRTRYRYEKGFLLHLKENNIAGDLRPLLRMEAAERLWEEFGSEEDEDAPQGS